MMHTCSSHVTWHPDTPNAKRSNTNAITRDPQPPNPQPCNRFEGEFFIENLLVRIHFFIVMIRWTGLAS